MGPFARGMVVAGATCTWSLCLAGQLTANLSIQVTLQGSTTQDCSAGTGSTIGYTAIVTRRAADGTNCLNPLYTVSQSSLNTRGPSDTGRAIAFPTSTNMLRVLYDPTLSPPTQQPLYTNSDGTFEVQIVW